MAQEQKVSFSITPGPWELNGAGFIGPGDIDGVERWNSGADDIIAQCAPISSADGYKRPREENMANGRAMAAVPDLLEALELAEATINRLNNRLNGFGSANGTLDVIHNALVKAGRRL